MFTLIFEVGPRSDIRRGSFQYTPGKCRHVLPYYMQTKVIVIKIPYMHVISMYTQ